MSTCRPRRLTRRSPSGSGLPTALRTTSGCRCSWCTTGRSTTRWRALPATCPRGSPGTGSPGCGPRCSARGRETAGIPPACATPGRCARPCCPRSPAGWRRACGWGWAPASARWPCCTRTAATRTRSTRCSSSPAASSGRASTPRSSGSPTTAEIVGFVTEVHDGGLPPRPVPAVLTCGVIEENIENNRLMIKTLRGHGLPGGPARGTRHA